MSVQLSSYENLELHRCGSTLELVLNRPDQRNAMTRELGEEMSAVLTEIADDRSIRALVIRGSGKVFCAGGDIKGFSRIFQEKSLPSKEITEENRGFGSLLEQLNTLPQTVIMLVHGAAMGGGMGLVACADVAISTADAKFSLTETSIGLIPAQIAPFIVDRIGVALSRRLMLTGSLISGEEAASIGYVDYAEVDKAAAERRLQKVLAQVNRCAPSANAHTKAIIMHRRDNSLSSTLDLAAGLFGTVMLSDEGREGVSSFVEKRKPNWIDTEKLGGVDL